MKNQLQKLKRSSSIVSDGLKRADEANGKIMKCGLF